MCQPDFWPIDFICTTVAKGSAGLTIDKGSVGILTMVIFLIESTLNFDLCWLAGRTGDIVDSLLNIFFEIWTAASHLFTLLVRGKAVEPQSPSDCRHAFCWIFWGNNWGFFNWATTWRGPWTFTSPEPWFTFTTPTVSQFFTKVVPQLQSAPAGLSSWACFES